MSTPPPFVRVAPGFEDEFPDASPLATECFMNFGVVAGTVQAALTALFASHGVPSLGAFNVLTILEGADGPLAPSTIAERMVVSRPTITGLLDTLEARRLVERRAHRTDGRRRVVVLTRRGRATVERLLPTVHAFERDVLSCFDGAEQQQLLDLLAKLEHHLVARFPHTEAGIRESTS